MQRYHLGLDEYYYYTPISDVYPRGEWSMLAVTYDATTQQGTLYINGLPAIEASIGFPGFDPALPLTLGDVPDYEYYGAVDDLKVYNYALEPLEIAILYTNVVPETVCFENPGADVSGPEGKPDCIVDVYDLVELAAGWLECNRVSTENPL